MIGDRAFVPSFKLEWSDPFRHWSASPVWSDRHGGGDRAMELGPGREITFDFIAPSAALDCLSLRFRADIHAETLVWIEFADADGSIKKRSRFHLEDVGDGEIQRVMDLRQVTLSAGARYSVSIKSPLAGENSGLALWGVQGRIGRWELPPRLEAFRDDRTFAPRGRRDGRTALKVALVVADPFSYRTAAVAASLTDRFPGQAFELYRSSPASELWRHLREADVVIFDGEVDCGHGPTDFSDLCAALRRYGVCTIMIHQDGALSGQAPPPLAPRVSAPLSLPDGQACEYVLDLPSALMLRSSATTPRAVAGLSCLGRVADLGVLVEQADQVRTPRVCVIAPAGDDLADVLPALAEQTYAGDIELALWIDGSGGDERLDIAPWISQANLRLQALGIGSRSVKAIDCAFDKGGWKAPLRANGLPDADLYILSSSVPSSIGGLVASCVYEHASSEAQILHQTMAPPDQAALGRSTGPHSDMLGPSLNGVVLDRQRDVISLTRSALEQIRALA